MGFEIGALFDGRYEVQFVIPDAYHPVEQAVALDRETGEKVTLNLFSKADLPGEKSLRYLETELTKRIGVEHPNIARLYRVSRWEDELKNQTLYFVTEYFDGESLAKRIERLPTSPFSLRQVVRILQQIASGVAALHAAELLATHLYPKTILLGDDLTVKLPAFAFVSSSQWMRDQSAIFRRSGTNYRYVAPEMITPTGVIVGHQKTDVYLFGILAFELASGMVPFDGVKETIIEMQRYEPVPSLSVGTEIPEWFDHLVRDCMNKSPLQRPFIEAVSTLLGERLEAEEDPTLVYPDRSAVSVLFVEDNKLDQLFISRLLKEERCPFTFHFASSLERAKKMIASKRYDVIVTDYVLPDGTALDLLKGESGIPTIVVTGSDAHEVRQAVLAAGAYDCLFKESGQRHLRVVPTLLTRIVELSSLRREISELRDTVSQTLRNLEELTDGNRPPALNEILQQLRKCIETQSREDSEKGGSHVLSAKPSH